MNQISLIARHVEEVEGAEEVGNRGNEDKEGAAAGATTGTVLGGIGGFLIGVGVLAIPGGGPILAAGVGISALASTLAVQELVQQQEILSVVITLVSLQTEQIQRQTNALERLANSVEKMTDFAAQSSQ